MKKKPFTVPVASRLLQLPEYLFGRLNDVKYRKRRRDEDVIDLGMGNPTDPPPTIVVEKLRSAVLDPRNHRYSASIGVGNLRMEAARLYKRLWNVTLDPETEVVATICLALMGPGDTAIVPNPAFPIHVHGLTLAGSNVITIPWMPYEKWLAALVETLKAMIPKPKLLILCFPNNPTSVTVELDFFKEIVKIARQYDLMVLHDFAYGRTCFDGYKAPSFLEVRGAKKIAVEFTTLSKPYNMAGWRVGFCVGNADMVKALAKIKGYYDYGIFQAIQIASIVAMRHCDTFALEQAKIYQERRDVLCRGLERIGWPMEKPKASMFAWVPIPEKYRTVSTFDLSMFLMNEANVSVSPGSGFGEQGEGFLRMSLVENSHRLTQAVRQIDRAMKKFGK
jgi:alanine-synthesizing transaminase